jgi:hypothetical protein
MTGSLTCIPYEIISYIVSALSLEDIVSLSRTCKSLYCLVQDDQICRNVLQVRYAHSPSSFERLSEFSGQTLGKI